MVDDEPKDTRKKKDKKADGEANYTYKLIKLKQIGTCVRIYMYMSL